MTVAYNPYSLAGKTVLVTGASSGIGQATAVESARLGATVVLTARHERRLQETLGMLEGEGHRYIIADMAVPDAIESLVQELPPLHGCVCNAGFNFVRLIPFTKPSDVSSMFQVNTVSQMLLVRNIVRQKKLRPGASVVFTASISARGLSAPGNSLYSATKGALVSYMKSAALELAPKRIRCNAVSPGMVETALKAAKTEITDEQWEQSRQRYPLKRFGQPSDVAWAIIYLLSDASAWVTGTELVIDGGRSLE